MRVQITTYVSSEQRVVVAQVLVEETQEFLKVCDKVLRDVVAVQIVVDLRQQVKSLKKNLELRSILCISLNHFVRSLQLQKMKRAKLLLVTLSHGMYSRHCLNQCCTLKFDCLPKKLDGRARRSSPRQS